eukprot:gene1634-1812_t
MPKNLKKKYRGQKYRKDWEKEKWAYGWLSVSKKGSYKADCSICDKDLAIGKSELIAHTKTGLQKRLSNNVGSNHSLTDFMEVNSFSKINAELNAVALIARRNISFNFWNNCLAPYAHKKLVEEMKSSRGFSILCDKATDKTFCVNVRYVNDKCEPTTKRYRLLLVGKEGGADALFELLATTFAEDEIEWNDVIGYASDGENLMQGRNNSLLTQMKAAVPDLYILKCYCHSFNLVAGHACETLSNTAEQLTHDIYNYFKDSPNRKKIFEEFQHFYDCEPHKILKSCQTRWLSLSQCLTRIISQWPALEYFFTAEIFETKSLQAEKILQHLKLNYIKATFEFIDFVLGDLKGLRVLAQETVNAKVPHERERFSTRCRNWYREAVHQILNRIDITEPVLKAVQSIHQAVIVDRKAATDATGVLALKRPRLFQVNCQMMFENGDLSWLISVLSMKNKGQ